MTLGLKGPLDSLEQSEKPASDQPSPSASLIERRKEKRYATNDHVEISLLDAGGGPRLWGTVLDVSRNGLRIELATPITKGVRVEVVLPVRAIIFGETRYCRRALNLYHIGLAIEDVYYAQPLSSKHIHDDQLSLYLVGKGLTVLEAIHLKNHLVACESCRDRLAEAEAVLHPLRKRS